MAIRSIFQLRRADCFDVVIVGGGLAGVCAALAAAREGARTALVHDRPVLGGNASSEIRVGASGAGAKSFLAVETGIVYELMLAQRAGTFAGSGPSTVDLTLLDIVRRESGLTLFLNAPITDVEVSEGRIQAVYANQLGSEIRWEIPGRLFVDASGDGVVGAAAGAAFRVGEEAASEFGESYAPAVASPRTLGSTLYYQAADTGRPVAFQPPDWAVRFEGEDSLRYRPHQHFQGGHFWMEVGWPHDAIRDNEQIRDELLARVLGVWDHVKNGCEAVGDKASTYALNWVGMVTGKRESRRFRGAHVLTQNEIQRRELFPDRIGYGGYFIDDHARDGILDVSKRPSFHDLSRVAALVAPYSVPLRSLFVTEPENLFLAGRVLSASRVAMNSLRVMLTLGALGQAAGIAAAQCAQKGITPQALSADPAAVAAVQQALLRGDATILRCPNTDPDDLARAAHVTASSTARLQAEPGENSLPLDRPLAQLIPVGAQGLQHTEVFLTNVGTKAARLRAWLVPAADVWDVAALDAAFADKEPALATEATVPAGQQGWLALDWDTAHTERGFYWLVLDACPGVSWQHTAERLPALSAAVREPERWWFALGPRDYRCFCARVAPDPDAYAAANILSGTARPETWTNLWRSDPEAGLPASLTLEWETPQRISCVHLTFDTDLSRNPEQMAARERPAASARDYRILVESAAGWQTMAVVQDNFQRKRVHHFPPHETRRLRVQIEATNGIPEARLYEVRAYSGSTVERR